MFLIGVATAALFVPGLASPAVAPRWAMLSILVPLLLLFRPQIAITGAHWLGLAYCAWAAVTIAWSPVPLDAVPAIVMLGTIAVSFMLGGSLEAGETRRLFTGLAVGIGASSALAGYQAFTGQSPVMALGGATGLYVNKNWLCEAAALVLVGCVGYRLWLPALVTLPAVILPMGRAGWLAAMVALAAHLGRRHFLTATALVLVGLMLAPRFLDPGSALLQTDTMVQRFILWHDTAAASVWYGRGLGSFTMEFARLKTLWTLPTLPFHPHNEFLMVYFELGAIGAALLLMIALSLFGPMSPGRLVLIAVAVEACFAFPTQNPVTAFVGAVCAGIAARSGLLARPAADHRGDALCGGVLGSVDPERGRLRPPLPCAADLPVQPPVQGRPAALCYDADQKGPRPWQPLRHSPPAA